MFIIALSEPLATKLEQNKNGFIVESVGLVSDDFPYTAFYAKKSFINSNKDLLVNFNKAIKMGMDYTLEHDSKDIAKVVQNQFNDTPLDTLETVIDRYKKADVWLSTPYLEEDFFNTLTKLLKDNNLIDKNVPYNNLVHNLYE